MVRKLGLIGVAWIGMLLLAAAPPANAQWFGFGVTAGPVFPSQWGYFYQPFPCAFPFCAQPVYWSPWVSASWGFWGGWGFFPRSSFVRPGFRPVFVRGRWGPRGSWGGGWASRGWGGGWGPRSSWGGGWAPRGSWGGGRMGGFSGGRGGGRR